MFGPMRVSVLLDSNGSNTTAVAAVAKLQQAAGDVERQARRRHRRDRAGRHPGGGIAGEGRRRRRHHIAQADGSAALDGVRKRFGGSIRNIVMADSTMRRRSLDGAQSCSTAGPRA